MTGKPTYEELERRVRELEILESERKRTEEALLENEAKYRSLTENMNDILWTADLGMNATYVSPSIEKVLGFTVEERLKQSLQEQMPPETLQMAAERLAEELEFDEERDPKRHASLELDYYHKDGSLRCLETALSFIRDEHGKPVGIHGISRDITERKQTEKNLKRIEWMLSGKPISNIEVQTETQDQGYGDLTELNRDGIILKSIGHERLKSFTNDYLELLGTSSAIYEANGDYAFGIFASGWCRMMDRASRNLCDTPDNGEALNSGRWLCHESCWTDCSKEAIAKCAQVDIECNGGIRLYAVPIFAIGNVIGVINFGYGDPPKDPEKLKMLADVYHLDYDDLLREATAYDSRPPYIIEMAKKRLNTTAKLIGSMVETKQAEEALRRSEKFLRQVIDASPNCIFIKDWDGKYVLVNKAIAKLYGVSKEKMLGRTNFDLAGTGSLDPEEAEKFLVDDQDVINRKTLKRVSEECLTSGDGTQNWFHTIKVPLSSDLMPNCMLGVATDITERKQAEEALEAQRAQLKSLFDYSGEAIVLLDIENDILDANSGFERIFGYSPEEARGKLIEDLICPERFRDTEAKELDEQAVEGIKDVEIIRKRKDGEEIDVIVSAGPIKIGDNVTGRFVVFDDITERKRAEEALRKTSESLQAILNNSPLLISEFDLEGRYILVNHAVTKLLEWHSSELVGKTFSEILPADTAELFAKRLDLVSNTRKPITVEDHLVTPEGDQHFITTVFPLFNASGQIRSIGGIAHDITERKQAEAEREKLQTQLHQAHKMESIGTLAG
jgi:PAS domain S-box-containing protein